MGWSREVAAFLKAARDSIFYSDHLHTSFPSAVEQNVDIGSELGDMSRYFWSLPSGGQIQPNPLKSYCMDQPVISLDFDKFQWISLEFGWSEGLDGRCGIRASCFQSEKHLERLRSDQREFTSDKIPKNIGFDQISKKS